jgi:drug/metabolite transporter (DMT)-like permease
MLLVAGSALAWSFGGTIARFLTLADSWGVVFWRSLSAALFLLMFMLVRDGLRGTLQLFRNMGWAGFSVAVCFAIASSTFVIALAYTTVANILLLQASGPLIAAVGAWALFGETVSKTTWAAITAVIFGVGVMVSPSLTGSVSPIGDGLALIITVVFAAATLITRRNAHVRMIPAVFTGIVMAGCVAFFMAGSLQASFHDHLWLVAFGALNLGLGLALFTMGARLIPAPLASLLGTLETLLAPIWVWIIHTEVPSTLTLVGGAIVFAALILHILAESTKSRIASA